jgi:type IV pilus assembly protein PilA
MNQQCARRRARRGFSLIELLIVIAIILVIASIAIPKLDQARMYTQEMAAIRQIGTIHSAQTQYYSQFGRFAGGMNELGPPSGGSADAKAANLIPEELAKGEKSGYKFELKHSPTGYVVSATPVAFNNTGRRTFYSDESLVIREHWGAEPATAESPAIK